MDNISGDLSYSYTQKLLLKTVGRLLVIKVSKTYTNNLIVIFIIVYRGYSMC